MSPVGSRQRGYAGCVCQYCRPTQDGKKCRKTSRQWKRAERQLVNKQIKEEQEQE